MTEAALSAFARDVRKQGVTLNGIAAKNIPDAGIGIIATKKLKAGQTVAAVPASLLYHNKNEAFQRLEIPSGWRTHAQLALMLSIDRDNDTPFMKLWRATWPSSTVLRQFMPMLWPAERRERLPPGAKTFLAVQQKNFDRDWQAVKAVCKTGGIPKKDFTYYWMLVNTRSFFWDHPDCEPEIEPAPFDESMALCPYLDFFNHEDNGCEVRVNADGYHVITDRKYAVGEELHVSYGKHSNEYLLVEYGFVLAVNEWDNLNLDQFLVSKLSEDNQTLLSNAGYLGEYFMVPSGSASKKWEPCFRTQVALRLLISDLSRDDWLSFVNGEESGDNEQARVDGLLVQILQETCSDAENMIKSLNSTTKADLVDMLAIRWQQIRRIATESLRIYVKN